MRKLRGNMFHPDPLKFIIREKLTKENIKTIPWYCLPFHGFVCFHILCAEFLEESFVVVAWWSYIVLASAYDRGLLLLHLL
jgi:hypothetical protein